MKYWKKLAETQRRIGRGFVLPSMPSDIADLVDSLKRALWKAVAPASTAHEKNVRIYLERSIAELNDRIDELESVDPDTEIGVLQENNLQFRKKIALMQDRIAELEDEVRRLKGE